jgi:hypothetical protein
MLPAQLLKGDTRIKSGYDEKGGRECRNMVLKHSKLAPMGSSPGMMELREELYLKAL